MWMGGGIVWKIILREGVEVWFWDKFRYEKWGMDNFVKWDRRYVNLRWVKG